MITTVTDSNSSKYSALFEAATTFLKENVGNFPNNGQGYESRIEVIQDMIDNDKSISSVQEYFSHLKDLLDLGGDTFLMLPLDEPYFEIDANKREIIIPAEFKKNGFGVKGDHTAENLIFKMPRFFDAMDLYNADIRIQWVDANKEEGITRIDVIDAKKDANYLYFMWPLTTAVTSYSGTIKFSVRFYILDATGLVYSYATKIATATINEGHNFDIAGWTGSIDHADDDFRANIRNSQNVGAESAADPFFIINLDNDVDRGWNADYVGSGPAGPILEAYLDEDNPQQVLAVEAGANDTGFIGYEWVYADQTVPSDQVTYKLIPEFDYLQVPTEEKANPIAGKRYYIKNNEDRYVATADFDESTDLYERISKVVIEKGNVLAEDGSSTQTLSHIVGIYQAIAKNSKNGNEATEKSLAVRFPAPDVLEFAEDGDLNDYIYLNNNNQGQASVDVTSDEHGALITYIWEKAIDINGPLDRPASDTNFVEVFRSSESNGYNISEPGIYRVQVKSTRNFEDKVIYSNVSRIVGMPVVPTILYPIEDVAVSSLNTNALLEARIAPINDALKSEDLSYQWYTDNNEPIEGACGDCGYDEYHSVYTAQLLVPEGTRMGYYCKIWNQVGEQKSEAITADFSVNPTKYDMPVGVNASTPEEVITALNSSATKINVIVDSPMTMPATLDIASGKDITMVVNADMTFTGTNQIKVNKNARLTIEPGSGTISSAQTTVLVDGGEVIVNGGTFESSVNHAIGVKNHGIVVVNGGSFTGQECAIGGVVNGAVVTVNGGTFNTRDNSVIGGNGSNHEDDNVEINIHGGTFTGNITTNGYVANVIYMPNKGTVNIDGGTLIANGGPAIVMRSGALNISGDANIEARGTSGTAGKVGDAQFNIDLDGIALCYNTSYAGTDNIKLNITGGSITGVDHSVHVYNERQTEDKPFEVNQPAISISGGILNPPYSE